MADCAVFQLIGKSLPEAECDEIYVGTYIGKYTVYEYVCVYKHMNICVCGSLFYFIYPRDINLKVSK